LARPVKNDPLKAAGEAAREKVQALHEVAKRLAHGG
jgi:hypothetical protein